VKYLRIRSELLAKFWGTDMYLGASVPLPEGSRDPGCGTPWGTCRRRSNRRTTASSR
jgi:hypothetical protein